jgi:uncharacterized protein YdcH (DUF465 family)
MRHAPPRDLAFQVRRLEQQHTELKKRIADLDRKHYLNAREQLEVQQLKKQKLAAKDALIQVRRDLAAE